MSTNSILSFPLPPREGRGESILPVLVRPNPRARSFTFRIKDGALVVTVPTHYRESDLRASIEQMRPRLIRLWVRTQALAERQSQSRHIDWDFRIDTDDFTLSIQRDSTVPSGQCRLTRREGNVTLLSNPDFDFDNPERQAWLERVIVEQVRARPKVVLSARLKELSQQFNLPFGSVSINAARGRWGSCGIHLKVGETLVNHASPYDIHLSLFTLLLPRHLQRFILLHELTHTLEMNHSPRFHAQLDKMLGGTEHDCIREMHQYTTSIFHFVGSETGAGQESEDEF